MKDTGAPEANPDPPRKMRARSVYDRDVSTPTLNKLRLVPPHLFEDQMRQRKTTNPLSSVYHTTIQRYFNYDLFPFLLLTFWIVI